MTENHWINMNESKKINSEKVILFGAGKGSEEFIKTDCSLVNRKIFF